ncbi:MAG: hypothetical protein NWF14_07115 [Candidatus Bathyarchaeota archaeon]|nr:hypothetical protein [Candidatus Bathyarchaeota archaeon]
MKRNLLEKKVKPIEAWGLPEVLRITGKQREDSSWKHGGRRGSLYPEFNHGLFEVFKNLGQLVEKYGFNRRHPAVKKASDYVFSCQTGKGDIRGNLGTQSMPYYCGVIMKLLVDAEYVDDFRIEKAFKWLLLVGHV